MALGIFMPISNYNAISNGIYCILILLFLRNNAGYWLFCIASGIFIYHVSKHSLYVIFDFFTISLVLGCLIIFTQKNIAEKDLKKIQNIYILFYTINLFLLLFPSYYASVEHRFQGIFGTVNLSVSVMCILGIATWELEKNIKSHIRTKLLIYNLIGLGILIFATRTRTLLFLIPYWLLQTYKFSDKRFFSFILFIAMLIFGQTIYESISDRMNFSGDKSTATRASLYDALTKRIKTNYGIIPYGSNESYIFIQRFTRNPNYSPHNDFLRYLYDWGIYFIVFTGYIIRLLVRSVRLNLEVYLLIFAYVPIALHNLLFLPITWLPFCLILHLHPKQYEDDELESTEDYNLSSQTIID